MNKKDLGERDICTKYVNCRIVAKVDELMALCDALEADLNTSTAARSCLLEATLQDALSS